MKAIILHSAMTGYITQPYENTYIKKEQIGKIGEQQQTPTNFLPEPYKTAPWPENSKPKTLYHVNGTTILKRIIKLLHLFNIHQIIFVAGWKKELIEEYNETHNLGIYIAYNPEWYDYYNSIKTFNIALKEITEEDDILLIMGDTYITYPILQQIITSPNPLAMSLGHIWKINKTHQHILQQLDTIEGVNFIDTKLSNLFLKLNVKTLQGLGDLDYYHQTDEYKSRLQDYLTKSNHTPTQKQKITDIYHLNKNHYIKKDNDIQTIILCAGIGQRLQPYTNTTNKTLLKIQEKTIIEHLLTQINQTDILNIYLIVGHQKNKIKYQIGNKYLNLHIHYITNPYYNQTGGAHSLQLTNHILKNHPSIIIDGDQYLHPTIIPQLLNTPDKNYTVLDPDTTKIKYQEEMLAYGENNQISHLQYKPPYRENTLGETLGIFKLTHETSRQLATILSTQPLTNEKTEYTTPLNKLIQKNPLKYITLNKNQTWYDIDTIQDYQEVKQNET